jgi:hypothetical protein
MGYLSKSERIGCYNHLGLEGGYRFFLRHHGLSRGNTIEIESSIKRCRSVLTGFYLEISLNKSALRAELPADSKIGKPVSLAGANTLVANIDSPIDPIIKSKCRIDELYTENSAPDKEWVVVCYTPTGGYHPDSKAVTLSLEFNQ